MYVKKIEPGLPLFLYNYSDKTLLGIFEAASSGQMNIDPYAWTLEGSQRTPYPAQVYHDSCVMFDFSIVFDLHGSARVQCFNDLKITIISKVCCYSATYTEPVVHTLNPPLIVIVRGCLGFTFWIE